MAQSALPPPIMRIPREVRGIIFNWLPQTEMVKMRCICTDWKSEVDDFCEFSVILDERQPFLERISELRIKKCQVLYLMEPLRCDSFFRFPSLLRSLLILSENICAENLVILIKDTCEHVREFIGVLPLTLLTYANYASFTPKFDNLSKLRLSVSTLPNEPVMGPPKFQDNLFHRMLQFPMKKLTGFAIQIRCLGYQQCSNFSAQILSFVAHHHTTLKNVDFDLIQGHGMPLNELQPLRDEHVETINFKLLEKVCKLDSLRVVNSTAIGVDIWIQLLTQQKQLGFLETDILPAPNVLYKQIILNNQSTLVHVDIGDLTIDFDGDQEDERHFDSAVFQNCHHLRKLTLDRNCLRRRIAGGAQSAELINLHKLPEYLEELAINYFLVLSDELLILFSSGLGQNLKSLTLTQVGESEEFGVNGTVLENIIGMPNIDFVEISPLNFSQPEEKLKLNTILTRFGFSEGHSYFQLCKVSNNFQISFEDFMP